MNKLIGKISGIKQIRAKINVPKSVNDYINLKNKPSIESVVLVGNITLEQLGINKISNEEIANIIGG